MCYIIILLTSVYLLLNNSMNCNSAGANAMYLGKHGCLGAFSKLLDGIGKKNYVILKSVKLAYMTL